MEQPLGFAVIVFICWLIYTIFFRSSDDRKKKLFVKILNDYGLTLSDMMIYFCQYFGGHPDRDRESSGDILFGVKNGRLIFFESKKIIFEEPSTSGIGKYVFLPEWLENKNTSFKDKLTSGEGSISSKKMELGVSAELTHLFDIPINNIEDIQYFDATTSRTVAWVGGNHWAIPINMKKGDASVMIYWRNDGIRHSTEFRFVGLIQGLQANSRANALRNTFLRIRSKINE